jgi:hypothetical protein
MEDVKTPFRLINTSCGEAFVVHSMAAVDEHPDLLASTLAIWLEDELPALKALTPAERVLAFAKRRSALDGERSLRAGNPQRTAYGNAP